MMINVFAIIMAGGNGERFWPLSTPEKPKQFLDLFGGKALIRQAVDRLEGVIPPEQIYVITADRFVGMTRDVLPMLPEKNIIGEPCRRDTAAAVAVACGLVLKQGGRNAVGCILTADQLIEPVDLFRTTLTDSISLAADTNAIVTMGIAPTRPETGFGYIECGPRLEGQTETVFHDVRRFVEKPDLATAKFYLSNGGFLWNAGMFIWQAKTMREAFVQFADDFVSLIDALAVSSTPKEIVDAIYPGLRSISIDFAVMEHAKRIVVAESRFVWDDVGSWTAVEHHFPQDGQGNTVLGTAFLKDMSDSVVLNAPMFSSDLNGNSSAHHLIVAGLKDVVVVQTPTATLVCSKDKLSQMKTLLNLKQASLSVHE